MERGKETRERGRNKEESGPEVNGGTWRRNRSKGAGGEVKGWACKNNPCCSAFSLINKALSLYAS